MVIAWLCEGRIAAILGLKSILNTPYSNSRGVYCWSHCHTNRCGWSYIVLLDFFPFYFILFLPHFFFALLRSALERRKSRRYCVQFALLPSVHVSANNQIHVLFFLSFRFILFHSVATGTSAICFAFCFRFLNGWLVDWLVGWPSLCLFASERVSE